MKSEQQAKGYWALLSRDGHLKNFPWSIIGKRNKQLSINHYFFYIKKNP